MDDPDLSFLQTRVLTKEDAQLLGSKEVLTIISEEREDDQEANNVKNIANGHSRVLYPHKKSSHNQIEDLKVSNGVDPLLSNSRDTDSGMLLICCFNNCLIIYLQNRLFYEVLLHIHAFLIPILKFLFLYIYFHFHLHKVFG